MKQERKKNVMWLNKNVAGIFFSIFLVCAVLVGTLKVADMSVLAAEDGEAGNVTNEISDAELIYPDNLGRNGYDIVFVIDNSGSMWQQQSIRDRALHTVADLAVGSDVRIGSVFFGNNVYSTYQLTSVEDQDSYRDVIEKGLTLTAQDSKNRNTNIGEGLKAGLSLFEDQDTSRERIIILLSDGINENLEKNAAYKAIADKETEKQVKIIKEKGYPLYCAFVEKDYTDREYLRKLVNYFGSGSEYDNRLVTVSNDEIHKLADSMAEIFYDLNGGMKYKKLSLDSNGKYSFFIPELHISCLQIYLNNSQEIESVLKDSKGNIVEGWAEGDSIFYTEDQPVTGEWTLEVSGGTNGITGTIAYYTDICVKTSITGEIRRNGTVEFTCSFYDGEGQPVKLDKGSSVTADIIITDPETGDIEQKNRDIELKVNGDKAVSDKLKIEEIGDIHAVVHIGYDEFIALNYTVLKDQKISPIKPIAEDYNGSFLGFIPAMPDHGKMQFTRKLFTAITDPDSSEEDFSIENVAVFTDDNKLSAEIRDGKLVFTAEKGQWIPTSVEGMITFADQDGLTAEMNIKGCVINVMILYFIGVLIIVAAGVAIFFKRKHQKMVKIMKNYMGDFNKQLALSTEIRDECVNLKEQYEITGFQKSLDKLRKIIAEEEIPEEVQEILQLKEALPSGNMNCLFDEFQSAVNQVETTYAFAVDQRARYEVYKNLTFKELYSKQDAIRNAIHNLRSYNDESEEMLYRLKQKMSEVEVSKKHLEETLEFISIVKNRRFEDNIILHIDGYEAIYMKNKKDWYCVMDDILVMDQLPDDNIRTFFGENTRIVFMPYEIEDEETGKRQKGIIAVSDREFECRETSESEEFSARGTTAVFFRGTKYRLDVTGIGKVVLQLAR